jgi:hypothetical protein
MRDEFLGRDWADNHQAMSLDLHKLFKKIVFGFKRLNARQFDAPWKQARRNRSAVR